MRGEISLPEMEVCVLPDLSNVTSAAAVAPELLAIALRSTDKRTREKARALLADVPLVGPFVAGQKSTHRASSAERLWKLIRTVGRSKTGIDMPRFCGAIAEVAIQAEDVLLPSDVLASAAKLKQPMRPFYAAMPPMEILTLWDLPGVLPDGLDALTALRDLTLQGGRLDRDDHIDTLGELPGLVSLRSCLPVADLRFYDPLSHMERLDFGGAQSQLTDISALAGWQQLQFLNLSDTKIADISSLRGKEVLSYLNLANTQVSDISPLEGLPAVADLNLTRLKGVDLSVLASLPALKRLALDFVPVTDLSVLSGCARLETLRLWSNPIASLAPLASLPLVRLEILYAKTPDLEALAGCATLRSLRLVKSAVDPDALAALRSALPELSISV